MLFKQRNVICIAVVAMRVLLSIYILAGGYLVAADKHNYGHVVTLSCYASLLAFYLFTTPEEIASGSSSMFMLRASLLLMLPLVYIEAPTAESIQPLLALDGVLLVCWGLWK